MLFPLHARRAAEILAGIVVTALAAGIEPVTVAAQTQAQTPDRPETRTAPRPNTGAKAPAATQPAAKPADLPAVMQQIMGLFASGKYAEAIPLARQIIAEFDRLGGGALPLQAQNYTMLGDLHRFSGDFKAADAAMIKGLAIAEKAQGAAHPGTVPALLGVYHLRAAEGRYREAAVYLNRAVKIREASLPPGDPELWWIRVSQAKLAQQLGRPDDAVPLLTGALDAFARGLPANHPYLGPTANNLAQSYIALGRYREAEPLLNSAVKLTEQTAGANSPLAAVALNNLASLYRLQGRLLEAEDLHRRELAIAEDALGRDSLELVASLNNMALALDALQRPQEAEPLLQRALAIQRKHLKPSHPDIARTLNNLATIIGNDGRRDEARVLHEQSIELRKTAFGPQSTEVAVGLENLAALLFEDKQHDAALVRSKQALAINEASLPPNHPASALSLNNVGATLDGLGRHGEATPYLERALAAREGALGADHPDVLLTLVNLAANALDQAQWQRAHDLAGRAMALYDRSGVGGFSQQNADTAGDGNLSRMRGVFLIRAITAERLRTSPGADASALTADAFTALQREQTSASSTALRAASLRAAGGDETLGRLMRERQDIAEQWRARDQQLLAALGSPSAEREPAAEAKVRASLTTLEARARAIDQTLSRSYPSHAALTRPEPVPLADAQRLVPPSDALVVIAPTRTGTLVFAVTRERAKLIRSELKGADIARLVATLRCGLDATLWSAEPSRTDCLAKVTTAADGQLPFDLATAHALYAGLFGEVADVIADKRLRIVTSAELTTLPFQVLVTAAPPAEAGTDGVAKTPDFARTPWLALRHAITVLPSVDSLATLGTAAGAPGATPAQRRRVSKPYLAFANPLLLGGDGLDRRAYAKQSCREAASPQPFELASRAAKPVRALMRHSLDIETLRRQAPLPETADEVCAVAKLLGAGEADVLLGSRASLSEVKAMAARGVLSDYRVLHFATHGLVAGGSSSLEKALPEPAILLTPPPPGTTGTKLAFDNGLLAASDIAALKLDADWVVLSACNTASGGRTNAEALAGLARAFFFAGARGLLVSHWEVYSDAAVLIVTRAFEVWAADPARGRGGALSVAMAELAASPDVRQRHPAYWAPFVVVGLD